MGAFGSFAIRMSPKYSLVLWRSARASRTTVYWSHFFWKGQRFIAMKTSQISCQILDLRAVALIVLNVLHYRFYCRQPEYYLLNRNSCWDTFMRWGAFNIEEDKKWESGSLKSFPIKGEVQNGLGEKWSDEVEYSKILAESIKDGCAKYQLYSFIHIHHFTQDIASFFSSLIN